MIRRTLVIAVFIIVAAGLRGCAGARLRSLVGRSPWTPGRSLAHGRRGPTVVVGGAGAGTAAIALRAQSPLEGGAQP